MRPVTEQNFIDAMQIPFNRGIALFVIRERIFLSLWNRSYSFVKFDLRGIRFTWKNFERIDRVNRRLILPFLHRCYIFDRFRPKYQWISNIANYRNLDTLKITHC